MATEVIHEHIGTDTSGGAIGWIVGLIVLAVVLYMLFAYGLPSLQRSMQAPTIQVPGKIDVNLNQPQTPGQ